MYNNTSIKLIFLLQYKKEQLITW